MHSAVKSPVAQLFIAARNLAWEASLVCAAALQDPCKLSASEEVPDFVHIASEGLICIRVQPLKIY